MNRTERIDLLHKIAHTINHDHNGHFVAGETERLELIQELLKETGYRLTEVGLCHLYSKIPLTELKEKQDSIIVISSHVDTHENITEPFSEIREENKLYGTYDNSITNAAVLTLMLEERLPEHVVVAFTGNEEQAMRGATTLGMYLNDHHIRAKVIVTDVTDRGYKGKNAFSLENSCNCSRWTVKVMKTLADSEFKWKLRDIYMDDESCSYYGLGFECMSICIPTKGKMHSNSGLKTRLSTYNKYIDALCLAACA